MIGLVIAGLGLILDLSARPAHAERLPIKVYTSVSTDQSFNPQPEPPQPVRAPQALWTHALAKTEVVGDR